MTMEMLMQVYDGVERHWDVFVPEDEPEGVVAGRVEIEGGALLFFRTDAPANGFVTAYGPGGWVEVQPGQVSKAYAEKRGQA